MAQKRKRNPLGGSAAWRKPEVRKDRRGPADEKRWRKFESLLAERGVETRPDRRKKLGPADYRKLSRKWEKYSQYLNPANEFSFIPLKKNDERRKKVRDKIPAGSFTDKGVFVRRPKLTGRMRGRGRIRIDSGGNILGQIGRTQRRVTVSLNARTLARDPRSAVVDAIGNADELVPTGCRRVGALLKVNGHNARRGTISINQFFDYMAGKPIDDTDDDYSDEDDLGLIEQLRNPERQDGKRKGAMTYKQISQVFTIEVVYRCDNKRRKK